MDFSNRYVALGDSFTEGVGDHAPELPNGVRGWADRLAAHLASQDGDWGYANLAIRGRKMAQILDEQLEPALAMQPTLVTIYSGVNDLMRPAVDIDALLVSYDEAIGRLVGSGAQVLMFTGFDAKVSKIFARLRGRTAIYNELVREISDKHGTGLVDFWRFREFDDWRMWAEDRIHMSAPGHQRMAQRVLDALGRASSLPEPELPDLEAKSVAERLREQAEWTRDHVGPWIGRRVRGASSGDDLAPRWPQLRRP